MSIEVLKAERIVDAGLGLLLREIVLPATVWRDAAGDFAGAKNDTISIRLPSYAKARTRDLRSGAARTRDSLAEQKVDVTLDTDVYKDVKITDEELSLDIKEFGTQVLNPCMTGIVETLEEQLITTMSGATYAKSIAFTIGTDDAWKDMIVPARELLNKARVPTAGRVIAMGSEVESELLRTDLFVKANESGSNTALSDAMIGRKAGFTFVSAPGLAPDEAYAYHRTAYVMSSRAPAVPNGAPFGASRSFRDFALRIVQVLDPDTIEDILAMDSWVGTNVVKDPGYFNLDGQFVPTDATPGDAVTLTNPSAAADDILDTDTAHGYEAGDRVVFTALTGGTGLSTNTEYYVIAANLAAQTFQVSETLGGAAVDFSTDITAGSVRKAANELLVRAVKITV